MDTDAVYMEYEDRVDLFRTDPTDPEGIDPNEIKIDNFVEDKWATLIDAAMDSIDMER